MSSTRDVLSGASVSEITAVLVWMRYISVISPVILVQDCFLTLDDEVCLIFSSLPFFTRLTCPQVGLVWPGPLSLTKALYYINRYLSIFMAIYTNYR